MFSHFLSVCLEGGSGPSTTWPPTPSPTPPTPAGIWSRMISKSRTGVGEWVGKLWLVHFIILIDQLQFHNWQFSFRKKVCVIIWLKQVFNQYNDYLPSHQKKADIASAENETHISKFTGSYLTSETEKKISISFLRTLIFSPYPSITRCYFWMKRITIIPR